MPSFSFTIKRSYLIIAIILLLHSIAASVIFSLHVAYAIKSLLILLLLSSCLYIVYHDGLLLSSSSLQSLSYQQDLWWAQCNSGELRAVRIDSRTVVLDRFIFLCLREAESRRCIKSWICLYDYPSQEFKQLARTIRLTAGVTTNTNS